jgi:hypothetical protein
VGIDLGTTTGIAILDTNGSVISLSSKKETTKNEIVKHIMKFGNPLIIASDVNPLPKGIEKLASAVGSKVFYPNTSMTYKEKVKIVDDYKEKIRDSHQKDALAAALRAFKNYHSMLLKIDETVKKFERKDLFDEVVKRVLKKKTENIVDAVRDLIWRKGK